MKKRGSLLAAFKNAWNGIRYCVQFERNMKIHIAAGITALFFSWWFALEKYEVFILLFTIESVLVTEMINTAVETLADRVSPEVHPLAKIAKDVAAGAVLLTAIFSLIVGYMLFFKQI